MLIRTSDSIDQVVAHDRIAQQRERDREYVAYATQNSFVLTDLNDTELNPERQFGRVLSVQQVEQYVKQLAPTCYIFTESKTAHAIYKRIPPFHNGRPQKTDFMVCPYRVDSPLPEWSIMQGRREEVPDYDQLFSNKPLPPVEPGKLRPGWKVVYERDMEIKRGWRTIFARMIQEGLTHADAVERLLGGGDRQSWQQLVGKA